MAVKTAMKPHNNCLQGDALARAPEPNRYRAE
jgi:hypothetical protein